MQVGEIGQFSSYTFFFQVLETLNVFPTSSEKFLPPSFFCIAFPPGSSWKIWWQNRKWKNIPILFWHLHLGLHCAASSRMHPICYAHVEAWQGLSSPAFHFWACSSQLRVATDISISNGLKCYCLAIALDLINLRTLRKLCHCLLSHALTICLHCNINTPVHLRPLLRATFTLTPFTSVLFYQF